MLHIEFSQLAWNWPKQFWTVQYGTETDIKPTSYYRYSYRAYKPNVLRRARHQALPKHSSRRVTQSPADPDASSAGAGQLCGTLLAKRIIFWMTQRPPGPISSGWN